MAQPVEASARTTEQGTRAQAGVVDVARVRLPVPRAFDIGQNGAALVRLPFRRAYPLYADRRRE